MQWATWQRERERGLGGLVLGGGWTADCSGFKRMARLRLRESWGNVRTGNIKIGIHCMTFAHIFALICSLDELTDFTKNHVVHDGHRLNFFCFRLWIYPVGGYQTFFIYSEPILEHIVFMKSHVVLLILFLLVLYSSISVFQQCWIKMDNSLKKSCIYYPLQLVVKWFQWHMI